MCVRYRQVLMKSIKLQLSLPVHARGRHVGFFNSGLLRISKLSRLEIRYVPGDISDLEFGNHDFRVQAERSIRASFYLAQTSGGKTLEYPFKRF